MRRFVRVVPWKLSLTMKEFLDGERILTLWTYIWVFDKDLLWVVIAIHELLLWSYCTERMPEYEYTNKTNSIELRTTHFTNVSTFCFLTRRERSATSFLMIRITGFVSEVQKYNTSQAGSFAGGGVSGPYRGQYSRLGMHSNIRQRRRPQMKSICSASDQWGTRCKIVTMSFQNASTSRDYLKNSPDSGHCSSCYV